MTAEDTEKYGGHGALWANAVWVDDATVVAMFGAFDVDSLQFATRCLLDVSSEGSGR